VYLVFKENILIATLLIRGNKYIDIKFNAHESFWNNIHQVAQDQKIGKPNNLIVLGTQYLWVLMLCMSFFTPGRDIGSTPSTPLAMLSPSPFFLENKIHSLFYMIDTKCM
jgi:hypothetical protein